MGLLKKITETNLGFKGKQPPLFGLGKDSTLHNTSSLDGTPSFSSYKSAYLRKQKNTTLAGPKNPKRYVSPE